METKFSWKKFWILCIVVSSAVALVVSLVMALTVADRAVVQGVTNFDALTLRDDLIVGGYVRFENGTQLAEATDTVLTFNEFLGAGRTTTVTVYADGAITPTGTNCPITSTGAISLSCTTSIITGTVDGQLLFITNVDTSDVISVCDGANTNLSGIAVLGPQDTLLLMWNEYYTVWLELAQADN